jgi:hypothetical protein
VISCLATVHELASVRRRFSIAMISDGTMNLLDKRCQEGRKVEHPMRNPSSSSHRNKPSFLTERDAGISFK